MTTIPVSVQSVLPLRVLVAVHGCEPPGWAHETCRVVSTWASPAVRVLAVLDVPRAPLTSLIPAARRAYGAARARWIELEQARVQIAIDPLLPGLPRETEIAPAAAARGDLALAIAEAARAWPADVVVVGGCAPGLRAWFRPGPIHERLLRLAGCAVLVTSPPSAAARPPRWRAATGRSVPIGQGA